ncbi:hypothetical protein JW710_02185 [Candidatus Dojkabacteria bacterium]|nr:hypothetical protein [Candidatus Dojkabacteria bacterium]
MSNFLPVHEEIKPIYESKDLLAFDKPIGLPTTYRSTSDNSDCLIKRVSQHYPDVLTVQGFQPNEGGLLYRLDNLTSGIVLIARNQKTFDHLKEIQDKNLLIKRYFALCEKTRKFQNVALNQKTIETQNSKKYPTFMSLPQDFFNIVGLEPFETEKADYQIINYPIGHSKKSSRKMIAVKGKNYKTRGKSRSATTAFRILSAKDNLVLVDVIITKAIRHQIRVHLSSIGLGIIGDKIYHPNGAILDNPRLYLHCGIVSVTENPLEFE